MLYYIEIKSLIPTEGKEVNRMLACCAQEEESRESEEEVERIVKKHLFVFSHPDITGGQEWFIYLPDGLNPNQVYNAARAKGYGHLYSTGFKILYRYRKTKAFCRLTEE
ncbi:MAG: hypothetical protein Q8P78_02410 [bacterium]|nr:hypothetical protein [bacterium]